MLHQETRIPANGHSTQNQSLLNTCTCKRSTTDCRHGAHTQGPFAMRGHLDFARERVREQQHVARAHGTKWARHGEGSCIGSDIDGKGGADFAMSVWRAPGFSAASRSLLRGRSASSLREVRGATRQLPRLAPRAASAPCAGLSRAIGRPARRCSAFRRSDCSLRCLSGLTWCRGRPGRASSLRRRRGTWQARRQPGASTARTRPWPVTACGPRH